MCEPDKTTYHMDEEPRTPLFPKPHIVTLTREIVQEFIMDEPVDFVDFCQESYDSVVSSYLSYRQRELDEWLDCRIRGEG